MAVTRVTAGLVSGWRPARAVNAGNAQTWRKLTAANNATAAGWESATAADSLAKSSWHKGTAIDAATVALFSPGTATDATTATPWNWGTPLDAATTTLWAEGVGQDAATATAWGQGVVIDTTAATAWGYAGIKATASAPVSRLSTYSPPLGSAVVLGLEGVYSPPAGNTVELALVTTAAAVEEATPGYMPPSFGNVAFDLSRDYTQPTALLTGFNLAQAVNTSAQGDNYDPIMSAFWRAPPAQDTNTLTPWGKGLAKNAPSTAPRWEVEPGDPYTVTPDPITIKNSYLIMNNISLVTVQDRTPLAFESFTVSMDIDSHSYSLDVTLLNEASYKKVVPMSGPVDVELSINGHKLVFMINGGGDNKQSSGNTWNASGPTRSALLAAPYASQNDKTAAGVSDASALAANELTGTGFTLEWPTGLNRNAVTWLMPGGVFSYQGLAPIDVIKRLAATVGGVVIPSLTSDSLSVQPRWPLLPWALDSDNADVLIHESMIVSQGTEYSEAAGFNEIWISGQTDGYQTRVYIAASGGGMAAPEISDPWLTENPANIQRGAQELAEAQKMLTVSLGVIVMESGGPGIITPGQIIEVQHDTPALTWRGLVLANSISPGAGGVDLFQNLQIARPI